MYKVGDRVTVSVTRADPSRIQAHPHALVRRVGAAGFWVGHADDSPELFGPFTAAVLTPGWGRSPELEAAVRRLCVRG